MPTLRRSALALAALLLVPVLSPALRADDPPAKDDPRTAWFREAKFGMFIHWGIYSLLGRGEWVMYNEKIPVPEYEKLAGRFNPVQFDAREWVSIAKEAGMRYITITSKHHDGFCMFDSKLTDYCIVSHALPPGRPEGARRGVPPPGDQDLLLPLDHGLAPPRLPAAAALGEGRRGRRRAPPSTATSST